MQIYSKEQLIEMLTTLLNESSNVSATVRGYQFGSEMSEGKFEGWRTKILYALKNINIDASETINVISVLPSRKPKSIEAVEEQLKTLIDSLKHYRLKSVGLGLKPLLLRLKVAVSLKTSFPD